MNDDINSRINTLVEKYANGNNSKFAQMIGTSEANIRNYRAKTAPKLETVIQISKTFEITFDWLLVGEGEMQKTETKEINNPQQIPHYEKNFIDKVISNNERLSEANSRLVKTNERLVELLAQKNENIETNTKAG